MGRYAARTDSRHVHRAQRDPCPAATDAGRDRQAQGEAHATRVWEEWARAIGGGSVEHLRWRSIVRMTSPWVIAAMRRREPVRHRGQRALSRAQTR